jgi:hypothetical protein
MEGLSANADTGQCQPSMATLRGLTFAAMRGLHTS